MRRHWDRFGRNFYTRHDYEGVDSEWAQGLMDHLRDQLPQLKDRRLAAFEVEQADDFSYTDPIDGSLSQHQGIRILFKGGARLVYRLSGTGTEGATLRVYIENHEPDPARYHQDPQQALAELIEIADVLADIKQRTGRTAPSVIT